MNLWVNESSDNDESSNSEYDEVGEDANKGSAGNGMVKYSWVCSFVVGFLITLWT